MKNKKILLLMLMLVSLLPTGCNEVSKNVFYVVDVWKDTIGGNPTAVALIVPGNGFRNDLVEDNPRFIVTFSLMHFNGIRRSSRYSIAELEEVGIVPPCALPYVKGNMKANNTPNIKVTEKAGDESLLWLDDKFIKDNKFHIYFSKAGDPEPVAKIVTDDPDIYARFKPNQPYSSKKMPLAAVLDKLVKIQPVVEKPDKS
jgi:hypothetical protein